MVNLGSFRKIHFNSNHDRRVFVFVDTCISQI